MPELDLEQAVRDHKSMKRLAAQVERQQTKLDALKKRLQAAELIWKMVEGVPISRKDVSQGTPRISLQQVGGDTQSLIIVEWLPGKSPDPQFPWTCSYCGGYAEATAESGTKKYYFQTEGRATDRAIHMIVSNAK